MKVRDLFGDAPPVETVAADVPVSEVLRVLAAGGREAVAVRSGDRFAGVFGPRELLACCRRGSPVVFDRVPVGEAADPQPVSAGPDEDVGAVLERACRSRACRVAVLADGRPVAILDTLDLVRAHLKILNDEVAHLQDYIHDLHDAPLD